MNRQIPSIFTYGQAEAFIESHGIDFTAFLSEFDKYPYYARNTVLRWLGY